MREHTSLKMNQRTALLEEIGNEETSLPCSASRDSRHSQLDFLQVIQLGSENAAKIGCSSKMKLGDSGTEMMQES